MILAALAAATTASPAAWSAAPALDAFLQRNYADPLGDGHPRYDAGQIDLNGDGTLETLVFLRGSAWCGSGGCKLLVLASTKTDFEVLGSTTLTWPPVRVLTSKTHGWRDIAVTVAGGGERPHEAVLTFDGTRYPSNPTVPPARVGTDEEPGDQVIEAPPPPLPT